MKYLIEYIRENLMLEPLGEVTAVEDTLNELSGNYILINGKDTGIFIADADYMKWIEDKYTKLINNIKG